jgi:hypothetical protein
VSLTVLAGKILLRVLVGLFNIASDIESVTRGFWDSEAVVQRDTRRDDTNADKCAPHLVDSYLAISSASIVSRS